MDEARAAVGSIIKSGLRAREITRRIRGVLSKTDTAKTPLDINDGVHEAIAFASDQRCGPILRYRYTPIQA